MANVLSNEKKQQVIALGRLGWSLRRIQGATGVRRETAAGYLKAAGISVRPPGWERRAGSKPAIEVITDFGAGNPASGIGCDPASPEPCLPAPPVLDTPKPAIEVTTDFGVESQGLRASVDILPPEPIPELTFEPGASKPAHGVINDAELAPASVAPPTRSPSASACEPYRELIELALTRGRNAMGAHGGARPFQSPLHRGTCFNIVAARHSLARSSFQSPLHRGTCFNVNLRVAKAPRHFQFQSPLHRGTCFNGFRAL